MNETGRKYYCYLSSIKHERNNRAEVMVKYKFTHEKQQKIFNTVLNMNETTENILYSIKH